MYRLCAHTQMHKNYASVCTHTHTHYNLSQIFYWWLTLLVHSQTDHEVRNVQNMYWTRTLLPDQVAHCIMQSFSMMYCGRVLAIQMKYYRSPGRFYGRKPININLQCHELWICDRNTKKKSMPVTKCAAANGKNQYRPTLRPMDHSYLLKGTGILSITINVSFLKSCRHKHLSVDLLNKLSYAYLNTITKVTQYKVIIQTPRKKLVIHHLHWTGGGMSDRPTHVTYSYNMIINLNTPCCYSKTRNKSYVRILRWPQRRTVVWVLQTPLITPYAFFLSEQSNTDII